MSRWAQVPARETLALDGRAARRHPVRVVHDAAATSAGGFAQHEGAMWHELKGTTTRNGFVAACMRGPLRRRRYRAASYLAGSEEEAEMAIDCLRPALRAIPSFRKWLRSAAGNRLSDPGS
ncbi:MAG: hypothetical protein FGM37_11550 [Phycisphaerales bacterium]|nr:hypothetical protein [Phycisphaerales bacterium]